MAKYGAISTSSAIDELRQRRAIQRVINDAQVVIANPKAGAREKQEARLVIEQFGHFGS